MCGLNEGVLCNIRYLSETHLKLKSREISSPHNLFINHPVVLTKVQNDWTSGMDVMGERDFTRFGVKMSFGRISYIAQHPWQDLNGRPSDSGSHINRQKLIDQLANA